MHKEKQKKKNKKVLISTLLMGIGTGVLLVLIIQYFYSSSNTLTSNENQKDTFPMVVQTKIPTHETISDKKKITSVKEDTDSVLKENDTKLFSDSVIINKNINNPYIIIENEDSIAQDELLFQKTITFSSAINPKQQELDSLLIDDKTPPKINRLIIEFWRSPVNYTGYKMNPEKLILFGFYQIDEVFLETKDEKIQLKYKNNIFLLENTDDFKPLYLKRINNKK